jgi:hypothetical protein
MAIYIITGETGEYEDWNKWTVGAFLDKMSCSSYLKRLNDYLIKNNVPLSICICRKFSKKPLSGFLDLKLKENLRDSGVEYKIEELEVLDSKILDEELEVLDSKILDSKIKEQI